MAENSYYQSIVNSWVFENNEVFKLNYLTKILRVINGDGNVFEDCRVLGIAADLARE